MSALSIYAGPVAARTLRQHGMNPDLFEVMVGASGGPKWFVLYGLDRVLFSDFLPKKSGTLITLGSSAGAWRLSCLGTVNPLKAIDDLAFGYSGQRYSTRPSEQEISNSMRRLLTSVLGSDGPKQLANNPRIHTHIVVDRCKGAGASRIRALQSLHLGLSAATNVLSRHSLSWFFQRILFTNDVAKSPWQHLTDIDTALVALTEKNLLDVLIASGSIPFVLEGVREIEGAISGLYWDGGITDYHFDLPFCSPDRLVLYPHFSPRVVPGWFDKRLKWRKPDPKHFQNVVLLTPSEEFVAGLPGSKIPDRTDVHAYSEQERLLVWSTVLKESQRLGDEFQQLVATGEGLQRIRPLEFV
ncbi:MAG: hypothetical protein OXD01_04675 [Gammaproteobacteria bacterium]|nr:hypothetical protein [Gammaproteobacteria bacterium]